MTATVGVHCPDGIVVGADSKRSKGSLSSDVIEKISFDPVNNIIATAAGRDDIDKLFKDVSLSVSSDQDFTGQERKYPFWSKLDTNIPKTMRDCFNEIGLPSTIQFEFEGMVAYYDSSQNRYNLVSYGPDIFPNSIPVGEYAVLGSGAEQTIPFLDFFANITCNNNIPSVVKGMALTYWSLKHAIKIAPKYIGPPIRIAIMKNTSSGVATRWMTEDEESFCNLYMSQHEEGIRMTEAIIENSRMLSDADVPEFKDLQNTTDGKASE